MIYHISSVVLEISDQISAVLLAVQAGKCHSGSDDILGGVLEEDEQVLFVPGIVLSLHGLGVWESGWSSSSSDDSSIGILCVSYPSEGAEAVLLSPSKAWQAAHWPSKMDLPAWGSPSGTSTLGSALSFLGGIFLSLK